MTGLKDLPTDWLVQELKFRAGLADGRRKRRRKEQLDRYFSQTIYDELRVRLDGLGLDGAISTKANWGDDDRRDIVDLGKSRSVRYTDEDVATINANVQRIGIIFEKSRLDRHPPTGLSTKACADYYRNPALCPNVPFAGQQIVRPPAGTGFLIDGDTIATAAHVLKQADELSHFRIAFGYCLEQTSHTTVQLDPGSVFRLNKLISEKNEIWRVRLDGRPGLGHLSVGKPAEKHAVYTIGHPMGLPMKIADNAHISRVGKKRFWANLDVFPANSGSPVFDAESHQVVGVVDAQSGKHTEIWEAGDGGKDCRILLRCPESKKKRTQCALADCRILS